jgi:hypothetical protein
MQAAPLAASLAGVAATYLLARGLGCRRPPAMVAGGIMALAPMAVVFGTRLKPYAFDALSCCVLLAAAVGVASGPSLRRWAGLSALAAAAPLFSASTLPVALTAILWCGWTTGWAPDVTRTGRRMAIAIPATYIVAMAAYAVTVLGAVPPPLHDSWASHYVSGPASARFVLDEFAAGIFYRHGPTGPLLLAAAAAGLVWARRDLALLVLGPVALAFGLAVAHRAPFGGGRVDIHLYPCIALAVALTIERVLDRWGRLDGHLPAVAVVAGLALAATVTGHRLADRNPYPGVDTAGMIAAFRADLRPGDGVVVAPFTRYAFALYDRRPPRVILSSRYSTGFTVASRDPEVLILPAEFYETGYDPGAAVGFGRQRIRIWFLATDTPPTDTAPEVQDHEYEPERRLLADGFVVERRVDVAGGHLDLLVRA